ncbi:xaa-Pro aminopeptidase ApepP-like [Bacillus rossius redtenbacheri]|uniref:xaa-Pro aminopeptidase ApepP-like n=1 Tax=Bacillus rossius redtenbacheri TaxID=93214 RepID=UPI002FDD5D4D
MWSSAASVLIVAAWCLREGASHVTSGSGVEAAAGPEDRLACGLGDSPPATRQDTTERLARLRQQMVVANITAYIIIHGDDHQSLFLAERDERRQYVSGFSGAGDAVVTLERAALWTDSRYYIQADEQLDCNWLLMKTGFITTPTIAQWLAAELQAGDSVSSDPRIATFSQWSSWQAHFNSYNISLKLYTQNLVDEIWGTEESRPDYSNQSISILSTDYTGATWQQKLGELRREMAAQQVDVLVLTMLDEVAWVLNLRGAENRYTPLFRSYLLVAADWSTLFLPAERHAPQLSAYLLADLEDSSQAVRIRPYEDIWTTLAEVGTNYSRVWFPSAYSYARGASFFAVQTVPNEKRYFATSPVLLKKAIKNEVEIRAMRNGHLKDAVALCQMLATLEDDIENEKRDWDELSVAMEVTKLRMAQEGCVGPSFGTISAFGAHSSMAHYQPDHNSNIAVTRASLFMLDSGGQYPGCTTDVTRTMHYGTPTPLQIDIYTRLLIGCIDLVSTVFPAGSTMGQLEVVLRRPLYALGLDYGHGSTHGIGSFLGVHEAFNTVYQEHFFGSQEPGYYRPNEFGMRLENIVMVVKANFSDVTHDSSTYLTFEPVTFVPYETKLIDLTKMSSEQIAWLNRYHEQTRLLVGPELLRQGHTSTHQWLLRKTRPVTRDSTASGAGVRGASYNIIMLIIVSSLLELVQ